MPQRMAAGIEQITHRVLPGNPRSANLGIVFANLLRQHGGLEIHPPAKSPGKSIEVRIRTGCFVELSSMSGTDAT